MTVSQEQLAVIAKAQGVEVSELPVGNAIESGKHFDDARGSAERAFADGALDTPAELVGIVDKDIVNIVDEEITVLDHMVVFKEPETGYLAIADGRGYCNISKNQAKNLIKLLEKALESE